MINDNFNLDKKSARRLALLKRNGLFGENTLGCEITRATTLNDLIAAYSLVHDAFVAKGIIQPHSSGMRLRCYEASPDMATFVVKHNGQVVGVQSIILDSQDLGLPADCAFLPEIDQLRANGHMLFEATNNAVATEYRNTFIMNEMIRPFYSYAISNYAGGGG